MEWKINGICNLKILLKPSNFVISELIDVISTSLFKMQVGYKYFEKYMKGLQMAIPFFTSKIPNTKFLLFIDDSIVNDPVLFGRIKRMNNNKLIIIHFTCPAYLEFKLKGSGKGHTELFGTLIRFLPFFQFDRNFTKNVICIDADVDAIDANHLLLNYDIFQKIKSQYQYDTNMFYELLAKWSLPDDYTIIANRHMCKYKFPLYLLTDYINCMKDKTCTDMETIKSQMDYNKYHFYPYGNDEYFLNNIFLGYIKNNKITYSISIRYVITAPLYYLNRQNIIPSDSVNGKYLEEKLRYIMDDNSNKTYKQLIDDFDKIFYPYIYQNVNEINPRAKLVAYKYYDFILELWKNSDYRIFEKQTLKKILKSRSYISKHNLIIYYGDRKKKRYLFPGFIKI